MSVIIEHHEKWMVTAFLHCLGGEKKKIILNNLELVKDEQLPNLYKASKQLSDLCWQEIQRRRRES